MCGSADWIFGRAGSASAATVTLRGSLVLIEALGPAAQVVLDLTSAARLAERIEDWLDRLEGWEA
jgi:hypothetical protein